MKQVVLLLAVKIPDHVLLARVKWLLSVVLSAGQGWLRLLHDSSGFSLIMFFSSAPLADPKLFFYPASRGTKAGLDIKRVLARVLVEAVLARRDRLPLHPLAEVPRQAYLEK